MQNPAKLDSKKYTNLMSKKFFDKKYTLEYDKWLESPFLGHIERMQKFFVSKILNFKKNDRILDVGFGTGKYLLYMASHGIRVVGLDYSKEMVRTTKRKIANKKGLKINLVIGDATNLPFKSNAFTKAISINTLAYLVDDVQAISEIKRVITQNAVLDGINKTELRMIYPLISIINSARSLLGKEPIGVYKNYYTVGGLGKKIVKAGMKFSAAYGCGVTLPCLSKDVFGINLPSPFYVLQVFPYTYKLFAALEKKFGDKFPIKYLGTHIMAEARKN